MYHPISVPSLLTLHIPAHLTLAYSVAATANVAAPNAASATAIEPPHHALGVHDHAFVHATENSVAHAEVFQASD